MAFLNSAGYRFVPLTDLSALREIFRDRAQALSIKGTVLLSTEGINLGMSGTPEAIGEFKTWLWADARFAGMTFREGFSESCSFQRLKVKIKKEIITLRQPQVDVTEDRAPAMSPQVLKSWLDEKRDFILIDTRNEYEIAHGTFEGALNPHIAHFSELPEKLAGVAKDKPVVMYCTGGIRCEKSTRYMELQGYKEVYQLDGGILNYFKEVGGAHYQGGCYVFDQREVVFPST